MPFAGAMNQRMHSLAGLGRGGDTALAHLTPGEVVVPKSIGQMYPDLVEAIAEAIRRRGRNPRDFIVGAPEGNVNAMTGMEEFGLGGDGVGGGEAGDSPGGSGGVGGDGGGGLGGTSDTAHDVAGGPVGTADTTGGTTGLGGFSPGSDFGGFSPTPPAGSTPPGPIDLGGLDPFGSASPSPAPNPGADFSNFSPTPPAGSTPPGPIDPGGLDPFAGDQRGRFGLDTFGGGLANRSSFAASSPQSRGPQSGAGSQTAADKEVRGLQGAAEPMASRGFFGDAFDAITKGFQPTPKNIAIGGLTSLLGPQFSAATTLARGILGGIKGPPTYTDILNDLLGQESTPTATAQSDAQGGPLGDPMGGRESGEGARGSPQPVTQQTVQTQPLAAVPNAPPTSGALPPQEAARIADVLGVSNDPLQARAQIATFALNSNDNDFRTAEAASLWETLVANSYTPNPGLLDIERQYMAEVLGFGSQAYEGEDEAARTLAGRGSPIRRAA